MLKSALFAALALVGAGLCSAAARPAALSPAERRREAAAVPPGFVYVPGGECRLGTDDPDADDDARPARRAYVPSFYLGRCEVNHAEWRRFRPDHVIPPGYARRPVTNVPLPEAEAYCRFVGGRLPTDVEWEKAARGPDGRRYPWGDRFELNRARLRRQPLPPGTCAAPGFRAGLADVVSYPQGASPYGALHMAGNAWEWVAGWYGGDPERRIIRGGAVGYGERAARTYHRAIEGAGVT